VGWRFLSFPKHPDRVWIPLSLVSNGYWGSVPLCKEPGRELDYHMHLMQ